jgi:methyl-accepting chemotaxis protein
VRRLVGLPQEVANLSEGLAGLRQDVADLRGEVTGLAGRLPAAPAADDASDPGDVDSELSEQISERLAVLEDGLDEVGARLEGMARDAIGEVTAALQQLTKRVDLLAARPALTAEELDDALRRLGQPLAARSAVEGSMSGGQDVSSAT